MSLRHAILGVLSASPLTGYDLVRYLHGSVGYVWPAPKSQIYPELRKMEELGLVEATVAPRGTYARKRIYSVTEEGIAELRRWAAAGIEYPPDRDPIRLKVLFFDIASFDDMREQLRAHVAHYTKRLEQWEARAASLRARTLPLLRKRLERRPPEEHEAVAELKALAFDGNVARARAEIEWAERGLALVDDLETRRGKRSGGSGRRKAAR